MMVEKAQFTEKGFVTSVKELFAGTPIEKKMNYDRLSETTLDYMGVYRQCEVMREQVEPYMIKWEAGTILHTKDGKALMIIHVPSASKPYHLLNLATGQTIRSMNHAESMKDTWPYGAFDLVGNFNPQILKVEKYK